ncbi:MAG TPA: hypothetical protein VJY36_04135 [Candidatus Bathyarchaeia archaeon]|nr:hypothetical protein [Candidatus Bathyarchaeia archaeon]
MKGEKVELGIGYGILLAAALLVTVICVGLIFLLFSLFLLATTVGSNNIFYSDFPLKLFSK